ncbi:MAG: hypothetical protein ACI8UZ_003083 [Akkermansiaceae bacterium]|jgi:hypothetical protein
MCRSIAEMENQRETACGDKKAEFEATRRDARILFSKIEAHSEELRQMYG